MEIKNRELKITIQSERRWWILSDYRIL